MGADVNNNYENRGLHEQAANKPASAGLAVAAPEYAMEQPSANPSYRHEDALKLIAWRLAQGLPKHLRKLPETQRSDQ